MIASHPPLRAAQELSTLGLIATSYEEFVRGVTGIVAPLADSEMVGMSVLSEIGGYFQLLRGSFGASEELVDSAQVVASETGIGAARVIATGMPSFSNDAPRELATVRGWLDAMAIERLMTLPLVTEGQVIGVMFVANHPTGFTAHDVRRLEQLSPFVATALQHVRRSIDLRRKETLGAIVSRAATAVASGRALAAISSPIYAEFAETIGACMLAITFAGESSPRVLIQTIHVPTSARTRFLADGAAHRVATRTVVRRPRGPGDVGSATLHLPVAVAGKREATLSLLRIPGDPYSKYEVEVIRRLTNVTALGWATERLEHERAQTVRMQERQRIADDLHDEVAQVLFSGKLALQSVIEQVGNDQPFLLAVSRARDLLTASELSLREVMCRLEVPIVDGFLDRLGDTVHNAAHGFDLATHLRVNGVDEGRVTNLSNEVIEVALRATREAIINAGKHACASQVWVDTAVVGRWLTLSVTDDGTGVPPFREGYGLRSLRRQVHAVTGRLCITSDSANHSRVSVSLPIDSLASPEPP